MISASDTSALTLADLPTPAPAPSTSPRLRDPGPPTASARAYLRHGLPSIYRSPGRIAADRGRSPRFGLDFVGALEEVLDPVVALLDCLSAHLVPELAPPDMLDLIAAWLGVSFDETWSIERRRALVRRAPELARRRGTRGGLELALRLTFPDYPFRIEDGGGVVQSSAPDDVTAALRPREFVVYCDAPLPLEEQASIARLIDQLKPVGVGYRLRVRQSRKAESEEHQ